MNTIAEMMDSARKSGRKRIAVAAAQEASALEAAVDAWMNGLADPVLIGDLVAIDALAAELSLDLTRFELIHAKDPAAAAAEAVHVAGWTASAMAGPSSSAMRRTRSAPSARAAAMACGDGPSGVSFAESLKARFAPGAAVLPGT